MARQRSPKTTPEPSTPRGELALIERIRRRATSGKTGRHVRLGIGDDCAILRPPAGHEILVTTDFSLEGRHFRRDWHSPASAGHRTLARGLSDLASMGAKPLAAFLSLALPRAVATDPDWLDGFLDGLLSLASQNGTTLAGGDTSESPSDHVLADIILLGTAARGQALRRSGAQPGDLLYCTGALGGAAAELAQLASPQLRQANATDSPLSPFPSSSAASSPFPSSSAASSSFPLSSAASSSFPLSSAASSSAASLSAVLPSFPLLSFRSAAEESASAPAHASPDHISNHPHLFPKPRLAVGQALLRRKLATACIDLSDGLSTDLTHLCEASGVSAEIETASLPRHPLTNRMSPESALDAALHGGEDYELLFTAPPTTKMPKTIAGTPITRIGRILSGNRRQQKISLLKPDGSRTTLESKGWEHLR